MVVIVWGLGLVMGCVLFGVILLWSCVEFIGVFLKGFLRVIEFILNVVKWECIVVLFLEKFRFWKDSEYWKCFIWWSYLILGFGNCIKVG